MSPVPGELHSRPRSSLLRKAVEDPSDSQSTDIFLNGREWHLKPGPECDSKSQHAPLVCLWNLSRPPPCFSTRLLLVQKFLGSQLSLFWLPMWSFSSTHPFAGLLGVTHFSGSLQPWSSKPSLWVFVLEPHPHLHTVLGSRLSVGSTSCKSPLTRTMRVAALACSFEMVE